MPALSNHSSRGTSKLLLIGDPGAGKSGALASLAAEGYNLRVLDFDNGLDVLHDLLRSPKYGSGKFLDNVIYETLTDAMKKTNNRLIQTKATVWSRTADLLSHWKFPERPQADGTVWPAYDLGPLHTWTNRDVLVIDSLSFLASAAMDWIMAMNARLGGRAEQGDWFQAQQLLEGVFKTLYDDGVKCNVVVTAHVAYIGTEGGVQRGYPSSLGKALSPKIGRYFNSVLMVSSSGSGDKIKRVIKTNTSGIVELKNSAPSRVKPEYPQDTGLAQFFKDIQDQAAEPPKS